MAMRLTREQAKKLGVPVPPKNPKKSYGRDGKLSGKFDGKTGCDLVFDAACLDRGLPRPVHEFRFSPVRQFLADYCFDGWLLVEKDGGLYGRGKKCPTCGRRPPGAHSSIEQMRKDREKDREAARLGYVIIRFLPEEFDDGSAFAVIKEILDSRVEQP